MNRRSDMTKRSLLADFALAAVVALGSLCSATDHPGRPNRGAETFDSFAPAGPSQPFDEAAWRVQRLTESLEQSRTAAATNPLLVADAGYYEAELAAAGRLRARR
jgi:hypothetical protein